MAQLSSYLASLEQPLDLVLASDNTDSCQLIDFLNETKTKGDGTTLFRRASLRNMFYKIDTPATSPAKEEGVSPTSKKVDGESCAREG